MLFAVFYYLYLFVYEKIKKSKDASVLGTDWFPAAGMGEAGKEEDQPVPFTVRHKLILAVAGLSLVGFLYGALKLGWSDSQMAATFIFISVLAGLIGRLAANDIAKTFITGCQSLVYGALIVGMARSISVILENGSFSILSSMLWLHFWTDSARLPGQSACISPVRCFIFSSLQGLAKPLYLFQSWRRSLI